MQAVLEFDNMPVSCKECVLSFKRDNDWLCAGCEIKLFVDFDGDSRHKYCPLKPVKE